MAAAKLLEEKDTESIRCTGHTLLLVINSALKNTGPERAVGDAKCLVEHLKKNEQACSNLKEKQKKMDTPEHKLVQDASTRLNSRFYMINRLIEQSWPLTDSLSDPTITHRGNDILI